MQTFLNKVELMNVWRKKNREKKEKREREREIVKDLDFNVASKKEIKFLNT